MTEETKQPQLKIPKEIQECVELFTVIRESILEFKRTFEIEVLLMPSYNGKPNPSKANETSNLCDLVGSIQTKLKIRDFAKKTYFPASLFIKVDEIEILSTRAKTCLRNGGIVYIGDLVQLKEYEVLRFPDLGRMTMDEIKSLLKSKYGLELDTPIPGWGTNTEYLKKVIYETNN